MQSADDLKDSILSSCDLFIHQSIRYNNRYGKEYASESIIKRLNPHSRIIAIPNVYGLPECFFPQFRKGEEYKRLFPIKGTIFFRDTLIETTLKENGSIKKIIERYNNANTYKVEEIEEKWQEFIDKIKSREQEWDIKISKYLLENARKYQLFFDPNHPTPEFIKFISMELLKLLNINFNEQEVISLQIHALDSFEMPICRSVSEYFKLDYDLTKLNLRKTGNKILIGKMNLKRYVFQYYCMVWKEDSMPIWVKIRSFVIYCILASVGSFLNCLKLVVQKIKKLHLCDVNLLIT